MGSIMDAAGWSGFAALRANDSANEHDGSTAGQEVTSPASPGSNISLEGLQLAIELARSLTQLPRLGARSAIRALLGRRRDR